MEVMMLSTRYWASYRTTTPKIKNKVYMRLSVAEVDISKINPKS